MIIEPGVCQDQSRQINDLPGGRGFGEGQDYRGYRIEVNAVQVGDAWNATIRVRRTFSDMQPHVEHVTCRKPTAKTAEERAAVYARRWVDRHRAN